jgi:PAS domain S-box-containing protein
LLQAAGVTARVLGPSGSFDFIAVLIPLLLLIGMAHTESTLVDRVRVEAKEQILRFDTEFKARESMADLVRENERLEQQVDQLIERGIALEDSARENFQLFNENPQPMWLFDRRSLRILAANNAALPLYGFTLNEFLAKTSQDILPAEEFAEFLQHIARPASRDESPRVWRHRRKDGVLFQVEVRELDLRYADCSARLVLASDVAHRQKANPGCEPAQKSKIVREEPPPVPTIPLPQRAPLVTTTPVAQEAPAPAASPAAQKAASKTILLVEPDNRMRVMARMMLEWNSYRVVETDSCSVAETIWPGQAANIDLLLTAVALPGGVSGRQLADRLRKSKPALKVLFTYDSNKSREDLSDAELVAKPFNSAALLARLSECFPQSC